MTTTESVWLSVALQKSESVSYSRRDRPVKTPADGSSYRAIHLGGGHLDPTVLPQRAIDVEHRKSRLGHLFVVNGFLCVTDKGASVLRQFDLGNGVLQPLELARYDGVAAMDGSFWALNFGKKKNALAMEGSRAVDGPNWRGNCSAALDGADLWSDERVESGFFVSPHLGAALHKAGLAKAFHLLRCRIL